MLPKTNLWFVKSKRAQTSDDDETWLRGGVVPTLNAFDMGDTRATVVIVMREREGKAGGGKGALLTEDKTFTLATSNFHILFIFEATRVEDVRIYEKYCPTVARYWGTGGARVPYVYAIQGTVIGRSDEAGPQGKGFADDGEPMFTLDRVSGHGVAYSFDSLASNSMKSDNPNSGCREVDKSKTLDTAALNPNANQGGMAVLAFDSYNQSVSKTSQTIRSGVAGNDHVGMVMEKSTVRRLTPTECERLQGFPDGWTDGQADSHRYKQMGNAVAVPVVQWIINRMFL